MSYNDWSHVYDKLKQHSNCSTDNSNRRSYKSEQVIRSRYNLQLKK